jgi:ABC-type sugar transport system ATPase subunit
MIKVEHLYKSFDGREVLKDINVEYEPGKCNMIIGASGSGKTVLLKNLIGLMEPDRGEIYYGDNRLTGMSYAQKKELRQNIGILFQGSALFDFATVLENVMFPMEIGTWGDQFRAARAKYGEGLLAIGGMDKTALRKDKAAVDAELERLRGLVALGGFIPCPDHRIMPGSSFELVQYYAEEIKKIRL